MYFASLTTTTEPTGSSDSAYLLTDNWDDWFECNTMYKLLVFDAKSDQADCMMVLIGATPEGRKELVRSQVGLRESS